MHTLLNCQNRMDGRAHLSKIDDNSVRTVFFDPQYRGVLDKLSYGNEGARQAGRSALPQMTEEVIKEFLQNIDRVLQPSGHLFLWVDKYHLVEGISPWMQETSLEAVDMITWDKARIGMGYRSRRRCEYLLVLQKKPKRAKGSWTRHDIPDVWQEKVERVHAHRKPVALQQALIEATTRPGDLVLDPAAGSFSVLEACRETGRDFIGADILAPDCETRGA